MRPCRWMVAVQAQHAAFRRHYKRSWSYRQGVHNLLITFKQAFNRRLSSSRQRHYETTVLIRWSVYISTGPTAVAPPHRQRHYQTGVSNRRLTCSDSEIVIATILDRLQVPRSGSPARAYAYACEYHKSRPLSRKKCFYFSLAIFGRPW